MKRMMLVFCGMMIAGHAFGSMEEVDALGKKVEALEKRVAELEKKRIEALDKERQEELKRLAREVKVRKSWEAEREEQRKQILQIQEELRSAGVAKTVARSEQKVEDRVKYGLEINSFLKKHLDVQFGESMERFPTTHTTRPKEMSVGVFEEKSVPIVKRVWHFDTARGTTIDGKLYHIELTVKFDKKYSVASCEEQFAKAKDSILKAVCSRIPQSQLGNFGGYVVRCSGSERRYTLTIADTKMMVDRRKKEDAERRADQEKKRAEGETLPDPE